MAGKQSKEMSEAQRLILEKGMTPGEAAKRAGVRQASIYLRPWWKALQAKRAEEAAK